MVFDTEPDLLYHHSRRVFLFGALTGEREGIEYDPELLYIGAIFHDVGLVEAYSSKTERFEVDGANAARNFLKQYGVNGYDIEQVWMSIALHTTPGIPKHMKPVVALVTAGVEMDVLGIAYDASTELQRSQVVYAHPRVETFKNDIIDAFASGTICKPETTFGNVKADVLALRDPTYKRLNFCEIILGSAWEASKANWKTPQNIKDQYASASFVGRNRVVFNIKGNDFRLIVAVAYQIGVVYVKFVGTHAEYDKVDAATVEME
ncbi:MAG: HD domain-containing protein [Paraburkholderia sp.]|nr:MAG: HD domain-containing protein [Paraburkholderia sp.]